MRLCLFFSGCNYTIIPYRFWVLLGENKLSSRSSALGHSFHYYNYYYYRWPPKAHKVNGYHNNADIVATEMESRLVKSSKHALSNEYWYNIRVRCNKMNMGVSFSRKRGTDESAAEYVQYTLLVDNVMIPKENLLYK